MNQTTWIALAASAGLFAQESTAADGPPVRTPFVRTVDLDVNEAQEVTFSDRTSVRVKLLSLDETRDPIRDAVRQARVRVEVNSPPISLEEWRAFSGLDRHTVFANPLYRDTAGRNFRLDAKTPNRSAGSEGKTIGAPSD